MERRPHDRFQRVNDLRPVQERELVHHQERLGADGENVGVKRAGVDSLGVLLREDDARRVELVQPCERLRCLAGLARGKPARAGGLAEARPAPCEEVRRAAIGRREPRVVRGPLVGELSASGKRRVHREARVIREDHAKDARGDIDLDRSMKELL